MAPEVYGSGGDPPPDGCVKPIFNEWAWEQMKFLFESLHNTDF